MFYLTQHSIHFSLGGVGGRKKREVMPVVGCSFIAEIKYFAVTICSRSYTCNMRIYLSLVFGLIRESCFVLTCSIKVPIYPDYHCCCCSRLLGSILSISMHMQNFITIFHPVQEMGTFSLVQNLELSKT